eukprot:m.291320 g.291320  ORF g.291320 m.291320 type:complete len:928 (+) comp15826_c0_seq3:148-2931(+)
MSLSRPSSAPTCSQLDETTKDEARQLRLQLGSNSSRVPPMLLSEAVSARPASAPIDAMDRSQGLDDGFSQLNQESNSFMAQQRSLYGEETFASISQRVGASGAATAFRSGRTVSSEATLQPPPAPPPPPPPLSTKTSATLLAHHLPKAHRTAASVKRSRLVPRRPTHARDSTARSRQLKKSFVESRAQIAAKYDSQQEQSAASMASGHIGDLRGLPRNELESQSRASSLSSSRPTTGSVAYFPLSKRESRGSRLGLDGQQQFGGSSGHEGKFFARPAAVNGDDDEGDDNEEESEGEGDELSIHELLRSPRPSAPTPQAQPVPRTAEELHHMAEMDVLMQRLLLRRTEKKADLGDLDPLLAASLNPHPSEVIVAPKHPSSTPATSAASAASSATVHVGERRYLMNPVETPRSLATKKFIDESEVTDEDDDSTLRQATYRVNPRVPVTFTTIVSVPPVFDENDPWLKEETQMEMDAPLYRHDQLTKVYQALEVDYDLDGIVQDAISTLGNGLTRYALVDPMEGELPADALCPHGKSAMRHLYANEILQTGPILDPSTIGNETTQVKRTVGRRAVKGNGKGNVGAEIVHKKLARSFAERPEKIEGHPTDKALAKKVREYESWHKWWQSILSPTDYSEWLMEQNADFLPVVFSLLEDKEPPPIPEDALEMQQREETRRLFEARVGEIKKEKSSFVHGMWNCNTVQLGGLSADADDLAAEEFAGESQEDERQREFDSLQVRLQNVWDVLRLTALQRLDKALQYSSSAYTQNQHSLDTRTARLKGQRLLSLQHAVDLWEAAARAIQDREAVLADLEQFERVASDPARFFTRDSPMTRVQEASLRAKITSRLECASSVAHKTILRVESELKDTVTLNGVVYKDKMKRDVKEMLYWLRQEQRQLSLNAIHSAPTTPASSSLSLTQQQPLPQHQYQ